MQEKILDLKVKDLHDSPTQPRVTSGLSPQEMAEFTESIKRDGIMTPIIVREWPEKKGYEIIFGHRRTAAARTLKLDTVPAIVRAYDDKEVREKQLVEMLHREGISEYEEAGSYQDMLELKGADGKPIHTVESIAKAVGKNGRGDKVSPAYIYGRLKLLKMPELALTAYQAKVLPASTCLLLARIPDPKLAHKATCEVLRLYDTDPAKAEESLLEMIKDPEDDTQPMSFRAAKQHIHNNYMVRLKDAPFKLDDATVKPDAGPCTTCPLRTGNMEFADPKDMGGADVCTNPTCYKKKCDAFKRLQGVQLKEKTGADKLIAPGAVGLRKTRDWSGGGWKDKTVYEPTEHLRLTDKPKGKNKSYEDLLKLDDVETFVCADPSDARKHHVFVKIEDVAPQLKELKLPVPKPEPKEDSYEERQKKQEAAKQLTAAFLVAIESEVVKRLAKVPAKQVLLCHIINDSRVDSKAAAALKKMDLEGIVRTLLRWSTKPSYDGEINYNEERIAKLVGLDLKAERKAFDKQQAAAAAAKGAKETQAKVEELSAGKKPARK